MEYQAAESRATYSDDYMSYKIPPNGGGMMDCIFPGADTNAVARVAVAMDADCASQVSSSGPLNATPSVANIYLLRENARAINESNGS